MSFLLPIGLFKFSSGLTCLPPPYLTYKQQNACVRHGQVLRSCQSLPQLRAGSSRVCAWLRAPWPDPSSLSGQKMSVLGRAESISSIGCPAPNWNWRPSWRFGFAHHGSQEVWRLRSAEASITASRRLWWNARGQRRMPTTLRQPMGLPNFRVAVPLCCPS